MLRPAAITLALMLGVSGCGGDQPGNQQQGRAAGQAAPAGSDQALTPMAERVAVIGLLNKRNGIVRDFTLKPGQAVRLKDATVRLLACESTAPWESEKLTGAFVQLDVKGSDNRWRRAFSGWLYKESPSLNVVEHPVYDVWPKSCAMTHPDAAPSTEREGSAASSRSSAPNSAPAPEASPAPAAPAEAPSESADANIAT